MKKTLREWLRPILFLGQNPITLIGAVLTTSAAITIIGFWLFELVHRGPVPPYAGIVIFLVLPGIFVLGLLLMPLGGLWRRYRLTREGKLPHVYPSFDLKRPVLQRALLWIAGMTFVNVAIMGTASYKAVEHMDSPQFCGQTCHTVMAPEYTAYANSPHSRVACVDCHADLATLTEYPHPSTLAKVACARRGDQSDLPENTGRIRKDIPMITSVRKPTVNVCRAASDHHGFCAGKRVVRETTTAAISRSAHRPRQPNAQRIAVATMFAGAVGGALLVLFVVVWMPGAWGPRIALAVSGGVALTTALSGHASDSGTLTASVALDWIHVLAAAAWVGGLFALAVIVVRTTSLTLPDFVPMARRFSRLAGWSLATVLLIGAAAFGATSLLAAWSTSAAMLIADLTGARPSRPRPRAPPSLSPPSSQK